MDLSPAEEGDAVLALFERLKAVMLDQSAHYPLSVALNAIANLLAMGIIQSADPERDLVIVMIHVQQTVRFNLARTEERKPS